ncbi:MAG: gliding motility-associated C-terminal domain-containing protein [Candidatus Symbiothrix sp.]|jgi:gliding motility-associated-like protein|nr:gliding motility-associated C-terminal domain-containing protein [Candidatus Symbiothrix sp.]
MKKEILGIFAYFLCFSAFGQYTVEGGNGIPLSVVNKNRVEVFLLNELNNSKITFTSDGAATHQWYKYTDNISAALAIASTQTSGNTSYITDLDDACGYFVRTGGLDSYIWVIDYSLYAPRFFDMEINDDYPCEYLQLLTDMEAEPLYYRDVNGNRLYIPRTYHLEYNTLQWDDNLLTFAPLPVSITLNDNAANITIDPAPLCNTTFTLHGDEFATHFGIEQSLISTEYEAVAVEAHAIATEKKEQGISEQTASVSGDKLGGSAPYEITFDAYANEPIAGMYIWKILKINEKDTTDVLRYQGRSISYIFQQSGDYEVQLDVIGAKSVCINTSESFSVSIGISALDLPNVFSPGSSIGVNDQYRVSYKSIVSFKASIYNRWGNLLYHWEDPAQGWDGRVNGRYVPTGVYFIVVDAKGADGKEYKLSKDINVLRTEKK